MIAQASDKFMCTRKGGGAADFRKFQAQFKDVQGSHTNLNILKDIPGLDFIYFSMLLKGPRLPRDQFLSES